MPRPGSTWPTVKRPKVEFTGFLDFNDPAPTPEVLPPVVAPEPVIVPTGSTFTSDQKYRQTMTAGDVYEPEVIMPAAQDTTPVALVELNTGEVVQVNAQGEIIEAGALDVPAFWEVGDGWVKWGLIALGVAIFGTDVVRFLKKQGKR